MSTEVSDDSTSIGETCASLRREFEKIAHAMELIVEQINVPQMPRRPESFTCNLVTDVDGMVYAEKRMHLPFVPSPGLEVQFAHWSVTVRDVVWLDEDHEFQVNLEQVTQKQLDRLFFDGFELMP